MIKYYEGTVFNAGADAIVNTINCEGTMGAGLALEFKLRFPDMNDDYEKQCEEGVIKPGKVYYYKESDDCMIINFPTKWLFRYPSRIEWIEQGLQHFVATYKDNDIKSVAFPKLGASNGGLDWNEVKDIMEHYLEEVDAEVYICTDTMKTADGVEKDMLDIINNMTVESMTEIVRLTAKQKDSISRDIPYKRFWHMSKTPSIGSKTYAEMFRYCYEKAINGDDPQEQLSFL